ncbi:MAG TPA: amidohydrolase family protein [Chloroflexota bacterium]|jgi:hypothetical protein|nr:amidohydrolase family protein [Chloroflexota bacterium]
MHAEVVLRGGSVVTLDAQRPRAAAVAIGGGHFLAVGDDVDQHIGPTTKVVDTRGCAVVPGFADAHIHFGQYALGRQQVNLDGAATLDDGLEHLKAFARILSEGNWLRGRGWDRNRWGRLPTADDLDRAVGARPAALSSHDGHSLWLNSAALQAVGITGDTDAPAGGVIERDATGQPTGVIFENAQELARRRMPEPTLDDLTEAIRDALPVAAAAGLTGIHNIEDEHSFAAFRNLQASRKLTLRVYHGIRRGQLRNADELAVSQRASDWLRIGFVKLFSDGALGSRTAHLLEPYEGPTTGYRGVPTLTSEELVEDMSSATRAGLDVAVHAIGDAAVRSVLDAIERTKDQEPKAHERLFRIEHAQLVHPDDMPRFAELGVIASMQPIHATADWRAADAQWGERARHAYAWRSLLDAGARLAFGTDAPVERLEPLASLHAASTRRDPDDLPSAGWYPEQCLSLTEAVQAYTMGSAIAEGALERRGTITVGKDADLVVLRPDPFALEPDALRETLVALTMVGGRIVHEA